VLLSNLDLLATAPGGVARLRELILTLAVQGKLLAQDPADEPASVLLQKIRAEKDRLIAEGRIKRDKPLAEIAEEHKPFELPVGWEWVRLGALLKKVGAGSTPLGGREVYVSSGVKFLRSQNVWNEGLRLDGVAFIRPETHAKMAGTVVVANDLLFNITGASIGRCAVVPGDFDEANVSQHVTIIRTALTELNAFLHKVLVSRHVQQTVMDVQVGVSREGLSIAKLGQFLVPLPPLAEQSRIVTRVEALMRLCDALEAKGQLEAAQHAQLVSTLLGTLSASTTAEELAAHWQRVAQHFDLLLDRPEAVDALEQTLLQLAVRGLLVPQDPADEPASTLLQKIRAEKDRLIATGQIKRDKALAPITDEEKPFGLPVGWEWVPIDTLATVGTGTTPSRENPAFFVGGTTPWVTSGETGQTFIDTTEQHVTDVALAQTSLTVYPAGTLIVAMYGQGKTRGQVAELRIPAATNQACAAIALIESAAHHRAYVKLVFEKSYDEIRELSAGGAQPNLNVGKVKSTLIPLPPLPEQSRIVTRVTALRRLCADLRQRLAQQQGVQARLAQALVESVG
jgi:type I restriction enzyme S subunit